MTKILLVDDEPGYRDLLGVILSEEGFRVTTAPGPEVALAVATQLSPDVLVVDWMLNNDKTGLELAEILTRKYPHLQTIVISGYRPVDLEIQVERLRSYQFLTKPFDPDDLISAIRRAAGESASR